MSFVAINVLTVPEGGGSRLEERFAGRAGSVERSPGFEHFELLRPVEGTDSYLVYTRWRSREDFEAWTSSQSFAGGHAQTSSRPEAQQRAATESTIWTFDVAQHADPVVGAEPGTAVRWALRLLGAAVPRILDHTGREADRTVTVADIVALKARGQRLAQVTASTPAEAAAAEAAGIEMVVCMSDFVPAVREGSQRVFVTAAIDFSGAVTEDDLLRDALTALRDGADAVITARGLASVRRLSAEDIPVMGHLGFVPKKSSLYGGIRAVGRTAPEALDLWRRFQELEDAGAFAVECELIPAEVMAEIHRRTGLATISLGSGPDADVLFLFTSDLCGESERIPRHARAYADLAALHRQIDAERVRALTEFRADVASGGFPTGTEVARIDAAELEGFRQGLDKP